MAIWMSDAEMGANIEMSITASGFGRSSSSRPPPNRAAKYAICAMAEIAVAMAAATEPMRMSRLRTCMSSCAITPSISSAGIDFNKPCVAHTTAVRGPRPVAKAFGCSDGEMATRGIGMFARAASDATMR